MSVHVVPGRLLCLLLVLGLCSCASSPTDGGWSVSTPSRAGGYCRNQDGRGAHESPKRANAAPAYPPLFEVKQASRTKLLNDEEYKNVRDELVAARERVVARAKETTATEQDKQTTDNSLGSRTQRPGEQLTATASN